jgi:hypothetical protein
VAHLNAPDILSPRLPISASLAARHGDKNARVVVAIIATVAARIVTGLSVTIVPWRYQYLLIVTLSARMSSGNANTNA